MHPPQHRSNNQAEKDQKGDENTDDFFFLVQMLSGRPLHAKLEGHSSGNDMRRG